MQKSSVCSRERTQVYVMLTVVHGKNPPFGEVGKQTRKKVLINLPHEFCIVIALIN
jgi:hypothetical protein